VKKLAILSWLALVILLLAGQATRAADVDPDLDARIRAKLMKEKSKLNAEEANPVLKLREPDAPAASESECGSQNIGNVNTNGRPGAAPREVFVFAPNAINIVNARGCGN